MNENKMKELLERIFKNFKLGELIIFLKSFDIVNGKMSNNTLAIGKLNGVTFMTDAAAGKILGYCSEPKLKFCYKKDNKTAWVSTHNRSDAEFINIRINEMLHSNLVYKYILVAEMKKNFIDLLKVGFMNKWISTDNINKNTLEYIRNANPKTKEKIQEAQSNMPVNRRIVTPAAPTAKKEVAVTKDEYIDTILSSKQKVVKELKGYAAAIYTKNDSGIILHLYGKGAREFTPKVKIKSEQFLINNLVALSKQAKQCNFKIAVIATKDQSKLQSIKMDNVDVYTI
ncbi:MAG: hypothetical protein PUG10_07575 [Lachnospiraceae bacterium]|nr:hypothetical protein [Lachnospiraceae bacterium]